MGTVTLAQALAVKILILYKMLNWNQTKRTPIPKKSVFHRVAPTTEAEAYSDFPREHIFLCRLTSAEKAYLYDMEDEQEMVQIIENGNIVAFCWLENIEVDYEIVEHADAPWKVTINLVEIEYVIPPLDVDVDIVAAVSIEPPLWIVWHPAVSIEPPLWIVWHPAVSDEPNMEVAIHGAYNDEARIHVGLLSAFISGDDAFWGGVGYPSAC